MQRSPSFRKPRLQSHLVPLDVKYAFAGIFMTTQASPAFTKPRLHSQPLPYCCERALAGTAGPLWLAANWLASSIAATAITRQDVEDDFERWINMIHHHLFP